MDYTKGRNLFSYKGITAGKWWSNNGVLATASNKYFIFGSAQIPIISNTPLTLQFWQPTVTATGSNRAWYAKLSYFDESKTYIGGYRSTYFTTDHLIFTESPPDNAKYVAFSYQFERPVGDVNSTTVTVNTPTYRFKLEYGSEPTEWSPAPEDYDDYTGTVIPNVLARNTITLAQAVDISAYYRFYKLQSSTAAPPAKPTTITTLPPEGWSDTEPSYTEGSTNSLYFVDLTVFSDDTFNYSNVSLSSSYEAAKQAYNKAETIGDQVDGMAEIHYGTVAPTLSNAPASSWTDAETKDLHVDDLYYDTSSGYCYRFTKSGTTYSWSRIKDSDITSAASLAGAKKRIFVAQPTVPYDVGDLWVQGETGDILKCKTARSSGSYTASEWERASKYTDDTAAELTDKKAVSRGEQLVTNGTGLLGDNTNFSSLTFDGSVSNNSPGSFTKTNANKTTTLSDEFFPVDTNKRYRFEFDVKSLNGLSTMYSFASFYDIDKLLIQPNHVMFRPNTLTTLTADLKPGDTIVHLSDVSNYRTLGTNVWQRALIFWDYKNSFGYQYPSETYSRHYVSDVWANDDSIDYDNNTITLVSAWTGTTYPAGTYVSQGNSGAGYRYQGLVNRIIPSEWTHVVGYYDGVDYSGNLITNKFPPATAYAKVGFIWNYNSANDQAWVTNIQVYEDYKTDIETALNQSVWYAVCSTAAETTAKVATITPTTSNFRLIQGATVNVKIANTNSGAVGSLTLNVNNTGAKNIKYINNNGVANIPGANYLAGGRTYQFIYDGTYWVITNMNYNTDTINRTRYQAILIASEAITAGHIICGTSSGYRNLGASVSFDLSYPLLYAATTINKGATTGTRDNNYTAINGITYTNTGTITAGANGKTIYLIGSVSGNTFTIAAAPFLTTTVPTNENNLYYIPLGVMTSATVGYFLSSNKLYTYINGAFQAVDKGAAAIATATKQYFWHDTNGAHIGTVEGDGDSGYNSVWNTSGLALRNGTNNLAAFTASAVQFYDGTGNAAADIVAEFGGSGFFIGQDDKTKISYNSTDGLKLGKYVSILPSGVFKMVYSILDDDDYAYEFSINTQSRYMYMNAQGNTMQIGQSGFYFWNEIGHFLVHCPDGYAQISAFNSVLLSGYTASVSVSYSNNTATTSLSGNVIDINAPVINFDNADDTRTFRFENDAYRNGKTYAHDSVYPHACRFYGGQASSSNAIGLWDAKNNHSVWRYNDHDQYLELYTTIYEDGHRVDFPRFLGTTASGSFTLPITKGAYLIVTRHNSTAGLNGIWMVGLGNNSVFKLAGGANVTVTASGNKTVTITASGNVNVSSIYLGYTL